MKWVKQVVGLGQWGWMVDDRGIDAPLTSNFRCDYGDKAGG